MNFQKGLMSYIFLVSIFLISGPGLSQNKSVRLEHLGEPGVWFPEEGAGRILADVEELQIVNRGKASLVLDYENKLQIRLDRITFLKEALLVSDDIIEKKDVVVNLYRDMVAIEAGRADRYEDELNIWYNHHLLWVGIGVVATVVIQVVAVSILEETR